MCELTHRSSLVMAGLVPAIHVVGRRHALGVTRLRQPPDVDSRDKPGHGDKGVGGHAS